MKSLPQPLLSHGPCPGLGTSRLLLHGQSCLLSWESSHSALRWTPTVARSSSPSDQEGRRQSRGRDAEGRPALCRCLSPAPRGPAPSPPLAGAPPGVWTSGPVTLLPGPVAGWRKGPAGKIRELEELFVGAACTLSLFPDVPSPFPSPGPSGPALPFSSNLLQARCQQLVSFIKTRVKAILCY